jgi:hypothetical protein
MGKSVSEGKRKWTAYTQEEKMHAIAEFYNDGTYARTARKTGIPKKTLEGWVKSPEGQQWLVMIRENAEEEFRNQAAGIIQKGLAQINDRIDNGNTKTALYRGEVKEWKEPLTAKELTVTTGILVDKLRVSLNLPTRIARSEGNQDMLLDQFEKVTEKLLEKRANSAIPGDKVN